MVWSAKLIYKYRSADCKGREILNDSQTGWQLVINPGQDAAPFDTVRLLALDLCPALGISIPVWCDFCRCATHGKMMVR